MAGQAGPGFSQHPENKYKRNKNNILYLTKIPNHKFGNRRVGLCHNFRKEKSPSLHGYFIWLKVNGHRNCTYPEGFQTLKKWVTLSLPEF
jgi:hypothetical protein